MNTVLITITSEREGRNVSHAIHALQPNGVAVLQSSGCGNLVRAVEKARLRANGRPIGIVFRAGTGEQRALTGEVNTLRLL